MMAKRFELIKKSSIILMVGGLCLLLQPLVTFADIDDLFDSPVTPATQAQTTQATQAIKALHSIAFFYDVNPPENELHAFDAVVVQPGQGLDPKKFNRADSEAYAYVSVGEVGSLRSYRKKIKKSWVKAVNKTWKADVMDQANPEWRAFFVNKVLAPLWKKGYRGFFFDTMDSFNIFAKTEAEKQIQESGLVSLMQLIHEKFPGIKIILNRGFEIIPEVHNDITAVAAESLYGGWNESTKRYYTKSKNDRNWLKGKLLEIKEKYGLPVISIDYAAPGDRNKARRIAKKIKQDGIIPWVADGALNNVGVGEVEAMPREILTFFDSAKDKNKGSEDEKKRNSSVFQYGAMPLEYMGYIPKIIDVRQPPLNQVLPGRYAGIIVWVGGPVGKISYNLKAWLLKQKKQGMKILFMSEFPFKITEKNLAPWGIKYSSKIPVKGKISLVKEADWVKGEIKPFPSKLNFFPLSQKHEVALQLKSANGLTMDAVGIMPWGGYALHPYSLFSLPNKENRWVINPFKIFKRALRLPDLPVPDVTTDNGYRILISHIDGDAFISKAEWPGNPYAGEVMLDEIIKKYPIPITVSLIEGEFEKSSLSKANIQSLYSIARKTFALPWVEAATHTYSHPYQWATLASNPTMKGQNLALKGYVFSSEREILGSIGFINKNFMPKGKFCNVVLWTGNTSPPEETLKVVYGNGFLNMNGGETTIMNKKNSWVYVAPLGIYLGPYLQVFAPNQNENVYTNLWRGPFYGFRDVIQTFKLTNAPKRLKPIDIYYHYYSASKRASLTALDDVYTWALQQRSIKEFSSDYIRKVMDYYSMSIAKTDRGWQIRSHGDLREFRFDGLKSFPDLAASRNVLGFSRYLNTHYVHIGPKKQTNLRMVGTEPKTPYLRNANGFIEHWEKKNGVIRFTLKGYYPPLKFQFQNLAGYVVSGEDGRLLPITVKDGTSSFQLPIDQLKENLTIRKQQ